MTRQASCAPGPTRAELSRRGPRIVFGARAAVVGLGGTVGLLVTPPGHRPVAVGVVLVSVAWTAAVFAVTVRSRVEYQSPSSSRTHW